MVKIYTRTGDTGTTSLFGGRKVGKDHERLEAYGTVDELNSALGAARCQVVDEGADRLLRSVQNDLFDVGADLCVPAEGEGRPALRVAADQVRRLEAAIDQVNEALQPLRSFVLPGGTPAAAQLHVARAVCRRAERRAWELASREAVNEHALHYLNRLSDLLFVLARAANDGGRGDVLWEPGKTRSSSP